MDRCRLWDVIRPFIATLSIVLFTAIVVGVLTLGGVEWASGRPATPGVYRVLGAAVLLFLLARSASGTVTVGRGPILACLRTAPLLLVLFTAWTRHEVLPRGWGEPAILLVSLAAMGIDLLRRRRVVPAAAVAVPSPLPEEVRRLEAAGEAAYDRMYDARGSEVAACYSDAKEFFRAAAQLAREQGFPEEAQRLSDRLAHIKAVFRSQFS